MTAEGTPVIVKQFRKDKRKPHLSTSTKTKPVTSERSLRRYTAAGWSIQQRTRSSTDVWHTLSLPRESGRKVLRGEMPEPRELRAVYIEGKSKTPVM